MTKEETNQKRILVFGGSDMQLSIINQCINLGLYTVVIDPSKNAPAKTIADAYEIVGGQDFEGTCEVVRKHKIDGILTTATDKPLVMMARIAKEFNFPFIPIETAEITTNKYLMKQVFIENNIPCANIRLIDKIDDTLEYPLVMKPIDNSGSRGVIFCNNKIEAERYFSEVIEHTRKDKIAVENIVYGQEYSLESLHYEGKTILYQITEKYMTPKPYFTEMELLEPPLLSNEKVEEIRQIVEKISTAFNFHNCGSHNEVKIDQNGNIKVIEVSPRFAGDYITSTLVPLSTGLNVELNLIKIALGLEPDLTMPKNIAHSGIFYFNFKPGVVKKIIDYNYVREIEGVIVLKLDLEVGSIVNEIHLGPDRYGYIILQSDSREKMLKIRDQVYQEMEKNIVIE
jgi:carbamoyl-phosphate synthase large subunit